MISSWVGVHWLHDSISFEATAGVRIHAPIRHRKAPGLSRRDFLNLMRPMRFRRSLLPSIILLALIGCLGLPPRPTSVKLFDADNKLIGFVDLLEIKNGVRFRVHTMGLGGGVKGLNIHTNPSCEPPGFASAGPLFNPSLGQEDTVNQGDLPDVTVGTTEWADTTFDWSSVRLDAGERGLFQKGGTALVLTDQPDGTTGGSGQGATRIACGVVKDRPEER
jgi:superoxide dismutase, Cu-Zn family